MLSEELSNEYYYCYVLLSTDNISVVVFLTRKVCVCVCVCVCGGGGGGGGGSITYLVILGY